LILAKVVVDGALIVSSVVGGLLATGNEEQCRGAKEGGAFGARSLLK